MSSLLKDPVMQPSTSRLEKGQASFFAILYSHDEIMRVSSHLRARTRGWFEGEEGSGQTQRKKARLSRADPRKLVTASSRTELSRTRTTHRWDPKAGCSERERMWECAGVMQGCKPFLPI